MDSGEHNKEIIFGRALRVLRLHANPAISSIHAFSHALKISSKDLEIIESGKKPRCYMQAHANILELFSCDDESQLIRQAREISPDLSVPAWKLGKTSSSMTVTRYLDDKLRNLGRSEIGQVNTKSPPAKKAPVVAKKSKLDPRSARLLEPEDPSDDLPSPHKR